MGKTREIKGRMKAVGNIQRITKTMQMIATVRFNAAYRKAIASRPYSRKIAELTGELAAASGGSWSHPLLNAPAEPVGRELVLVITSNRGLCGGYNAGILRAAMAQLRQLQGAVAKDLEVIGRKGSAYFRFTKVDVSNYLSEFGDKVDYDQVQCLAERYMAEFTAGKFDAIRIVSMTFQSMSTQKVEVQTLLPLSTPAPGSATGSGSAGAKPAAGAAGSVEKRGEVQYDFSPEPKELLAELLPATVKVRLLQILNEAVVSEHIARMRAMKAATEAAGDMKKALTRQYNRARQAAITTELSEIIGGSVALK
ncbi:MAG: ATP synthase F1 subunit gamma [Phycisphaeraceae bacterium]|nr:ATP synthase F1 subunit gamma [Phycisphaeraceae bacterium]